MRLAIGPLLILAMLAPLGARAQVQAPTGRLMGVVIDSIGLEGARPGEGFRRVAGASVSLGEGGRRVTTDSLGRFEAAGLAPGRYRLAYWDTWLDRLGLPPLGGLVDVIADSAVGVALATPSIETYQRLQCDAVLPEGRGILIGEVRGDGGEPLPGVQVAASWTEMTANGTIITRDAQHRTSRSTASGGFVLCDLPVGGELDLSATRGGRDTASVIVAATTLVSRRDLAFGATARLMRVSGSVVDSTGRGVAGASLNFVGDSTSIARSDGNGAFVFHTDRPRSQQVLVRALGFEPARLDVEPVGDALELEAARLLPLAQGLDTVRVEERRDLLDWRPDFDRRRMLGLGGFVTEEQLKRMPRVTVNQLAQLARRVRVEGRLLKLRYGTGACFPRWYVDDTDMGRERNLPNERAPTLEPGEVQTFLDRAKSIEVYSAAQAPPKFNDFGGCGTIIVWTR